MSMLTRRLQLLIDPDRYRRLEAAARERKTSVAEVVRDAIDTALPGVDAKRRRAAREILAAPPMPVPSLEELRAELDELHSRGL